MCPKTEAKKAEMSSYPLSVFDWITHVLTVCTRPDIPHPASYLSQFNENPDEDLSTVYAIWTEEVSPFHRKKSKEQNPADKTGCYRWTSTSG
ncbi:unnamed protein product [Larinioides sclopetarius]|uniref:Uncharacterized protein n=1 Tax=Larinioides sclopetarius TaxID=280406 RepID=A0AAV2A5J6_9ARAC